MEKSKIIEVIGKVLAKANNNSNEHEVETALLKAQALMVKYGLSEQDIDLGDKEVKKEAVEETAIQGAKIPSWLKSLTVIISKNFKCEVLWRNGRGNNNRITFIGLPNDVKIATDTLLYAKNAIEELSKWYVADLVNTLNMTPHEERPYEFRNKFVTTKDLLGAKNDYIRGFVRGLDTKYKEQVEKNNWGLILVKDKAVTEYMDNIKTRKSTARDTSASSRDRSHYNKGFADGKSFDGNRRAIK